jgi:hypothetical protein
MTVFLLRRKNQNAAMQTKQLFWYLVYIDCSQHSELLSISNRGDNMSKTASISLASSTNLFGRLFATIDRLLLAYAEMEIRNGNVPRCGI